MSRYITTTEHRLMLALFHGNTSIFSSRDRVKAVFYFFLSRLIPYKEFYRSSTKVPYNDLTSVVVCGSM